MRVSIWLYLLEQTCLTCCLLLAIGLSAGMRKGSPVRLILVSATVAVVSAVMAGASTLLRGTALLCCAAGMPLLAWRGAPKRIWLRMIAAGSFLSLGLTGLMRFMSPFGWSAGLMVLLACLLLRAVPLMTPKPEEIPRLATVDVRHGSHHLTMTALIDSGNLLRDSVSGLPVIIVSRRAAQRLIQLPEEGKIVYPFRMLTVRTVSGTALMTVFHPDSVCLLLPEGWVRVETLLGVSPEGYDGFQALVPACLMRRESRLSAGMHIPDSEFS